MIALPAPVAALVAQLAELPGVDAVVLGGSRASGTHRPDSDWDLGVYYRATFEPSAVGRLGHEGYVSALGEWGPIVDGGAWLTVAGTSVDVLFRDTARVARWREEAEHGRFDVLAQSGHLAGAPTYLPVGELALCHPLAGELASLPDGEAGLRPPLASGSASLPDGEAGLRPPLASGLAGPAFPDALAAAAPARWEGRAAVALMFAGGHARLGDSAACAGMLANAALCAAHARLAGRREWALNEKRLVRRAGLERAEAVLASPGATPEALIASVAALAEALEIAPLSAR